MNIQNIDNGCSPVTETQSVKPVSFDKLKLSAGALNSRLIKVIENPKESLANRALAIQKISRTPSTASSESSLLRILSKRKLRLSFAALKTLGFIGSEKTFERLSKLKSLRYKSLIRQRNFSMMLIGFRLNLPGTNTILNNLLKGERHSGKPRTINLSFKLQPPKDISSMMKKFRLDDYGITLSGKTAFEIKAGTMDYYLLFNKKLENPTQWKDSFKINQLVGLLFMKERNTKYISQQYIVLANPLKDYVQIVVFRKDGEPLMRANLAYKEKTKSFILSNLPSRTHVGIGSKLRLGKENLLTVDLSYVRRYKKKSPAVIGVRSKAGV